MPPDDWKGQLGFFSLFRRDTSTHHDTSILADTAVQIKAHRGHAAAARASAPPVRLVTTQDAREPPAGVVRLELVRVPGAESVGRM